MKWIPGNPYWLIAALAFLSILALIVLPSHAQDSKSADPSNTIVVMTGPPMVCGSKSAMALSNPKTAVLFRGLSIPYEGLVALSVNAESGAWFLHMTRPDGLVCITYIGKGGIITYPGEPL